MKGGRCVRAELEFKELAGSLGYDLSAGTGRTDDWAEKGQFCLNDREFKKITEGVNVLEKEGDSGKRAAFLEKWTMELRRLRLEGLRELVLAFSASAASKKREEGDECAGRMKLLSDWLKVRDRYGKACLALLEGKGISGQMILREEARLLLTDIAAIQCLAASDEDAFVNICMPVPAARWLYGSLDEDGLWEELREDADILVKRAYADKIFREQMKFNRSVISPAEGLASRIMDRDFTNGELIRGYGNLYHLWLFVLDGMPPVLSGREHKHLQKLWKESMDACRELHSEAGLYNGGRLSGYGVLQVLIFMCEERYQTMLETEFSSALPSGR